MKKLLLLTALTASLLNTAFAGIIENKQTGETIELNLNFESREVEVISSANNVRNKVIQLSSIKKSKVGYANLVGDRAFSISGTDEYPVERIGFYIKYLRR